RRAKYIRDLVAAAQAGTKDGFPSAKPFPAAWTNMLGAPLLQGIVGLELPEFRGPLPRLARPMIARETKKTKEKRAPVGGSKMAGHPDLPDDSAWPTCELGPLGFLGQIALADIAGTQTARFLPPEGLLSFFAYQDYNTGEQPGNHDAKDDVQVLYSPDVAR